MMLGSAIVAAIITCVLISKAVIEAVYFHDRKATKKTLFCVRLISIGAWGALAFAFFFDHLS